MRPSRVAFIAALTVIGGTVLSRYVKPVGRIPGFSPNG